MLILNSTHCDRSNDTPFVGFFVHPEPFLTLIRPDGPMLARVNVADAVGKTCTGLFCVCHRILCQFAVVHRVVPIYLVMRPSDPGQATTLAIEAA
jgi:hypothetical protein